MSDAEHERMTLLWFAEDTVRHAFEEPCDTPRLDHPYWGRVLAMIARETGETPAQCLARLAERETTP